MTSLSRPDQQKARRPMQAHATLSEAWLVLTSSPDMPIR